MNATHRDVPPLELVGFNLDIGAKTLLRQLNLQIRKGEILGVVGENGRGKSSLLKAVAKIPGFENEGVRVDGTRQQEYSSEAYAKHVAYMPQLFDENLVGYKAFDVVLMSRFPYRGHFDNYDEHDRAVARQCLDRCLGTAYAERTVDTLSGGEKQKLSLACALCQQSRIILLDEPCSALDPASSADFVALLRSVVEERQCAVIVAGHDLQDIRKLCDRLLCLYLDGSHEVLRKENDFDLESKMHLLYGSTKTAPASASPSRQFSPRTLVATVALIALLLSPFLGHHVVFPWNDDAYILVSLRIPRVLWAFLTGSVLAASGSALQSLMRNDLASPFTIGQASGAGFGAVCAVTLSLHGYALPLLAFVGAILALSLVLWLQTRLGGDYAVKLLLSGIVVSVFLSSLSVAMTSWLDPEHLYRLLSWQWGSLEIVSCERLILAIPAILAVLALMRRSKALRLCEIGENFAASRGVDLKRTRRVVVLASTVAVSVVVAFSGPIAFVGLLVPHAVKALCGKRSLPHAFFFGGVALVCCDLVSRSVLPYASVPVGIVTALLGAPALAYILARGR